MTSILDMHVLTIFLEFAMCHSIVHLQPHCAHATPKFWLNNEESQLNGEKGLIRQT